MSHFNAIIINCSHQKLEVDLRKPLTIITKRSILDVAAVLDPPLVANFADIIEIATVFIKKTFKDSVKVTRIRNYVLKYMQSLTVFLYIAKFVDLH